MMKNERPENTTIFKELILNVILPSVISLLILGVFNFIQVRNILLEGNKKKNEIIQDEIVEILSFQDLFLDILEEDLEKRMSSISSKLVETILPRYHNLDGLNLYMLREELQMDPRFEDIYIIDGQGNVVNSTYVKDIGLNLFSFGKAHENLLVKTFNGGEFTSERFAPESKTQRLRKFSYQPTQDRSYIVELGFYSARADTLVTRVRKKIVDLATKFENISSIDLFILADKPFSINGKYDLNDSELENLMQAFLSKRSYKLRVDSTRNSHVIDYLYIDRHNTNLYKNAVVRIVSDNTHDRKMLVNELLKFLLIFSITILIVIVLTYKKTRIITDPIKNLVNKVDQISEGNFGERAEVIGNNEISTLSVQFNNMIEQLENYYNELEEKVKERTAEILHQKEEIQLQKDNIENQRNLLSQINRNLQSAYSEIESQKKHVTDSIVYAKRIQHSILPSDEFVKQLFPESFIFYEPKDIVSGDFYWFSKPGDKIIFGAIDCTGHGVPGAFMSIVGHNLLNNIINHHQIHDPALILDKLNIEISNTLKHKEGLYTIKDGMDLSICVYYPGKALLEYAGAFNPLYIVRKEEVIQYHADKHTIGAMTGDAIKRYNKHQIPLQKNDVIYLFTDGYADQIGGGENRKFLIRNFRELLLKISPNPMEVQKVILRDIFNDWKGGSFQVDDILIMGIRV